ncbi:hypothetical protein L0668_09955 [Paraglaciecola aquimarina]|uniref:O-antigen ligase-related domain-containing protein n=1 Tax=Paraglaciecola algarum TaxID=3050085 RepID=A0ABS9D6P4_9ALTE|nr:O-antigen ligase family protein [Paraglaciecola sp. G1-23]MCF2948430.1 hypothetical protein [Paraglaciecola sp. G1-23]
MSLSELVSRDTMELYRPFYYLLSFLFGYYVAKDSTSISNYILRHKILIYSVSGTIVFALISFLFFEQIGKNTLPLYTKEHNVLTRRLTGTFNNPYDFAFVAILPFAYAFIRYLRDGSFRFLLMALISLMAIVLTQSKAGAISIVFSIAIVYFLYPFIFHHKATNLAQMRRYIILPVLTFIGLASIVIYFGEQISYLIEGIIKLLGGNGDKSTNIRIEQIKFVLQHFSDEPHRLLLGFGPNKNKVEFLEILPLLYFYRYGVMGLLILSYWVIYSLSISYKMAKSANNEELKIISFSMFVWFSTTITAGIGNNVIDQSRVSFIYFCLIGFSTYSLSKRKLICKDN